MRLIFSYLDKLTIFAFIAEVRLIINRIKDVDPAEYQPNPTVAAMEAQLLATEQTAEAAKFGDRNAINFRNDARSIMMAMTVQQGGTVVSKNLTPAQAENLGFRLAKDPSPAPPIGAPADVKAKPTSVNNGVEISWRRTKYAYGFQVQKTQQDPNSGNVTWDDVIFTNRSKVVIEDLNNLQKYWFRVVGFSSHGQSPYSDPVSCLVL